MSIYDLIKTYGKGKGEETMWKSVHAISDFIENHAEDCGDIDKLKVCLYSIMSDGHYNEDFACELIHKMYFKDDNGNVQHGPYWTEEEMHKAYNLVKNTIPSCYNEWDFRVALNMMMSDNHNLIDEWFPEATDEELFSKILDMTINYLNDDDAPHPHTKVWSYFN